MSDQKYYYLKFKENFFEQPQIQAIESMPNGCNYTNILLKMYLKSLSGNGKLMVTDEIPYNPALLAKVTGHEIGVVEKAVQIFRNYELIDIMENGAIYMLDIQNYIGKSSDEADRKRDYRARIENEKLLCIPQLFPSDKCPDKCPDKIGHLSGQMSDFGQMSGQMSDKCPKKQMDKCPDKCPTELEIELDLEKEIYKSPGQPGPALGSYIDINLSKIFKIYKTEYKKNKGFESIISSAEVERLKSLNNNYGAEIAIEIIQRWFRDDYKNPWGAEVGYDITGKRMHNAIEKILVDINKTKIEKAKQIITDEDRKKYIDLGWEK